MKIYVLRHGHAPSIVECGARSDAERPLSDRGRNDVRAAARRLAARKAAPSIILSSPLLRARQTAEEAAAVLRPAEGVRVFPPLSNEMPGPDLLAALLRENPGAAEIMAVGHQPQLGELVATATGKTVEIRPGGLVALDGDSGGGTSLLWNENP